MGSSSVVRIQTGHGGADRLLTQFARYLIAGGLSFLVDFGVLVGLTEVAGIRYLVSAAVGFSCGVVLTYVLSTRWVFASRGLASRRLEFAVFALIGVTGLALNELLMYLLTALAGFDYRFSKLVAVGIVLVWNFGTRKAILFRASS